LKEELDQEPRPTVNTPSSIDGEAEEQKKTTRKKTAEDSRNVTRSPSVDDL
jgi:hypothetical protein